MHFLYSADLLQPRLPDEMLRDEAEKMAANRHGVSLMDSNTFALVRAAAYPPPQPGSCVVYRGWMLTPTEYGTLAASVERQGSGLYTSPEQYVATHYLPNWYPLLADLTPETVVLDPDAADLVPALERLKEQGWPRFFVKDYVKSLKTAGGSVINAPEEIERVMAEMRKFRGTIEGGLCVRRYEDFVPDSEVRYFVRDDMAYAPESQGLIPLVVSQCAERLSGSLGSRFFSVDVARRTDSVERVVEVGDGQVSDRVGWTVDAFVALWG